MLSAVKFAAAARLVARLTTLAWVRFVKRRVGALCVLLAL
jgi:hypothetical protein